MYTSGTTGDPKGVMLSNESLLVNVVGPDSVLQYIGEIVSTWLQTFIVKEFMVCSCIEFMLVSLALLLQFDQDDVYLSYLPLAHVFDRMFEEVFIYHGSKIGFWRGVWFLGSPCRPLGKMHIDISVMHL